MERRTSDMLQKARQQICHRSLWKPISLVVNCKAQPMIGCCCASVQLALSPKALEVGPTAPTGTSNNVVELSFIYCWIGRTQWYRWSLQTRRSHSCHHGNNSDAWTPPLLWYTKRFCLFVGGTGPSHSDSWVDIGNVFFIAFLYLPTNSIISCPDFHSMLLKSGQFNCMILLMLK